MNPSFLAPASALIVAVLAAASPADAGEPCLAEVDPSVLVGAPEEVYRRARDAFEARRWLEAGAIFRHVALAHPDHEVGAFAVQLALESTNVAMRDADQAACSARMTADLPAYKASYCGPGTKHDELCVTLHRIDRDLARLAADRLVSAADTERGSAARRKYREAGRAYLAIWSRVAKSCEANDKERCARSEEILFNAARAYRSGGALTDALAARGMLFDPKYHLEGTELGRRAVLDQARDYVGIFEVATAASLFERFGRESPKSTDAPDALNDAAVLYASLGDLPAARRQIELLAKSYGSKQPKRVATSLLGYARILDDARSYAEVERWLGAHRSVIEKAGTHEERAVMLGVLGRALSRQGKAKQADDAFASLARFPVDSFGRAKTGDDEARTLRSLGLALTAIGEAKLHLADQKRALAMKLTVQKSDPKSLLEKKAAVEGAERAYAEILAIGPVPPPGPVVAAAGRVARMRSQLWAQAAVAQGQGAAAPLLAQAKAANLSCVDLSQKFQRQDPGARACAAWLERHFPSEHAPVGELFVGPVLVGVGSVPPPAPLARDGEPAMYSPARD